MSKANSGGTTPLSLELSVTLAGFVAWCREHILNRAVAARVGAGETAIAPGLPAHYPDPARLVTHDCLGTDH